MTIPKGGAEGMIATLGGRFGGYALYLSQSFNWWYREALLRKIGLVVLALGVLLSLRAKERSRLGRVCIWAGAAMVIAVFGTRLIGFGNGKPTFTYNLMDLERTTWSGPSLGAGTHTVAFDFKYDGPGPGKGGTGVLSVDGKEVARKEVKHTIPLLMSIDETFDIGVDTRSGVDDHRYRVPFAFTGTIDTLTIKIGPSQMSEEEQHKAAAAVARATD